MKISKNKNISKKKTIVIALAALCLLLIGAGAFYAYNKANTLDGQNNKSADDSQTNQPNSDGVTEEDTPPLPTDTINPKQDTPTPTPQTTITITALNQTDNALQLRTLISVLDNKGTCTLTLTKGSSVITRTSGVQAGANSSTCEGFNVPLTDLSTGQWNIRVHFTSQSVLATTSAQKDIK